MSKEPVKKSGMRQSTLTSFFSRTTEGALPSSKRPALTNDRLDLPTDPWEKLEERYNCMDLCSGNIAEASHSESEVAAGPRDWSASSSSDIADKMDVGGSPAQKLSMLQDSDGEIEGDIELQNDDSDDETLCPSWSGVPLERMTRAVSPSTMVLPELRSSEQHTVLVKLPLVPDKVPTSSVGSFTDVWDFDHVKMPCSRRIRRPKSALYPQQGTIARWEIIRIAITRNFITWTDFKSALAEYHPGGFSATRCAGLVTFLQEDLSEQERTFFFSVILPYIANLVIELPFACSEPIPLLKAGMNHTITLSQHQIAHLLANAFFCTFHVDQTSSDETENLAGYPGLCFEQLFAGPPRKVSKRSHCMREKVKCLMTYFHKAKQERPSGLVSFTRRSLEQFPNWEDSRSLMSAVHITHKGKIEDEGVGCLQVDFANKRIGGGVLGTGCVQEEIRFVINPELIVSRLFTERMNDNECVIITGAERYNDYSGYCDSFKWTGPHADTIARDSWGRRMTQIVAIDATRFGKPEEQFKPQMLLRELNKAYVGFFRRPSEDFLGPLTAVATGNWGCGAFGGDKRLKFLLQLMACSEAKRDMVYYTFGESRLQQELFAMYNHLVGMDITVGDLYRILCLYHSDVVQRRTVTKGKGRQESLPLFKFIYDSFGGL